MVVIWVRWVEPTFNTRKGLTYRVRTSKIGGKSKQTPGGVDLYHYMDIISGKHHLLRQVKSFTALIERYDSWRKPMPGQTIRGATQGHDWWQIPILRQLLFISSTRNSAGFSFILPVESEASRRRSAAVPFGPHL